MPQLTIDLSDEAFARLQERAQEGDEGLETQVTRVLERSLLLSPQDSLWVSKRFQNALTSIKGFASTLLMDEDGTMFEHSDRMEFYKIIERECDWLRESIEGVSLQSKPDGRFSPRPTALRAVLEAVRDRALTSLNRKPTHQFILQLGDNLPQTFLTDEEELVEILDRYVDMGIKYSPEGGEVRLEIGVIGDGELSFSIQDQGLGLTPEFLEKFIRPLNALHPPERSIGGPGLYKDWAFARWHGGRFTVESEGLGKGTTVTLILPSLGAPSRKLADDPSFRAVTSALQNLCLSLLADIDCLRLQHESFTADARADLEVSLEEQVARLQKLAQSLTEVP